MQFLSFEIRVPDFQCQHLVAPGAADQPEQEDGPIRLIKCFRQFHDRINGDYPMRPAPTHGRDFDFPGGVAGSHAAQQPGPLEDAGKQVAKVPDGLGGIFLLFLELNEPLNLGPGDFSQYPVPKLWKKVFSLQTGVKPLRGIPLVRQEIQSVVIVPEFLEGESRAVIFTPCLELREPLIRHPSDLGFGAAGWNQDSRPLSSHDFPLVIMDVFPIAKSPLSVFLAN